MTKSCQTEEQAEAGVVRKKSSARRIKTFHGTTKKTGCLFFSKILRYLEFSKWLHGFTNRTGRPTKISSSIPNATVSKTRTSKEPIFLFAKMGQPFQSLLVHETQVDPVIAASIDGLKA